jgi:hypothetical protein
LEKVQSGQHHNRRRRSWKQEFQQQRVGGQKWVRGIGRDHSVGRVRIDLVASSSLETCKFSFPFFSSHLLENIRRNKVGVLFAISSKKGF